MPPSPLRSMLLKNLTPASRRQDHTTSPSASRAVRQKRVRVHRIPPRVRDDREPPLVWDGIARNKPVIWVGWEPEYFLRDDWTGQIKLKWQEKLTCARTATLVRVTSGIRRISAFDAKRSSENGHRIGVPGNGAHRHRDVRCAAHAFQRLRVQAEALTALTGAWPLMIFATC